MREVDIRPENIFSEYLRLTQIDAETFFTNSECVDIDCPACAALDKKYAFTKQGFDYQVCQNCETLYQSPRPLKVLFDNFYFDSPSSTFWGEQFFPAVSEIRREKIFKPRCEAIINKCQKWDFEPKTVIDVGAGFGVLLEEMQKLAPTAEYLAIEPGHILSKVCMDKGFDTLISTVEEAHEWHDKADLLTCFEVIEHTYNPLEFVAALKNILKPGKKVLVTGLCGDGFDIKILWEHSKNISPPHHINFMSVEGFKLLFERAGFVNVSVETPGKLDVDIVLNALNDESIRKNLNLSRLESHLVAQFKDNPHTLQQFLADNQLSSHCWIWAERPL